MRSQRRRLYGRFHAHKRHIRVFGPQRSNGRGGCRVAGDHNDIGPFVQEKFRDKTPAPLNVQRCFFSVRAMCIVGEIVILFLRQDLDELPVHREPAASGVKYAYRCHWFVPKFRQ